MKDFLKKHNKKCSEINSLLLRYGFVEVYDTIVNNNHKKEYRFLYLQLKPSIGLLVYNFNHKKNNDATQGFDMFMYCSDNVKDAIYQFHGHQKYKSFSDFALFSFQEKLERTLLILDQLKMEQNDDFFSVETKYGKISQELYNKSEDLNVICE